MLKSKFKRLRTLLIILLFLITITFCAFYRGLTISRFDLSSDKIYSKQPIRLVLLADLHATVYAPKQEPLIRRIIDLQPDLIILAGDMADDINPFDGMDMLLKSISSYCPCFYVTGSHDYWSGSIENIKDAISDYGVTVLEGQTEMLAINDQQIYISGLDDPVMAPALKGESENDAYARIMNTYFGNIDRKAYHILVAHRPDFYREYKALGFDLVLSGHTHGGQIRIPFILNGLYAPNQGYFPKYAGGLYDLQDTWLLVSRGLSYYPKLPRIFNPPEIVYLELHGNMEET